MLDTKDTINLNHQDASNGFLEISAFPRFKFNLISYNIPAVSNLSVPLSTVTPTGFPVTYQIPGTMLDYEPFICRFIVDDQMMNYQYLYYWLSCFVGSCDVDIFVPNSIIKSDEGVYIKKNLYSPASLSMLSSENTVKSKINFYDIYPTNIGEITYETNAPETIIKCSATFNYKYFSFS